MILPRAHQRRLLNTNMLERLSQSIKQRTRVARIFPNEKSCLRLITSVLLEIHEDWISGRLYFNMTADKNPYNDLPVAENSQEEVVQEPINLGLSPIALNA